ncbi:CDK-activating kinase assembly factor MAT1-like [Saccostrea echinata]|uniref:CDK-activating kinase assembly factor MAT1-like n=1 Tax=Saccostrea echinata TaxID=191078 RepID=UPI002A7ED1AC|nr:CDK-activating kinase assembly factor MAT1-like [Saccostrea echinata]
MDDQGCPRCKTTKYRNPSLKLLVNVCGHSLCETCVEALFVKGSGTCPECGTALRKTNFRVQLFEDPFIEKEIEVRKKILKDFNKKEEDFDTLEEYNDYIEKIETIIFNIINNVDVDETRQMVEQYKRDNKDQISKGRNKKSKDEEYLESLIEQEQDENVRKRKLIIEEEQRQKDTKKRHKEALLDELMFSDRSAMDILSEHKTDLDKENELRAPVMPTTKFSTGIKLGAQGPFMSVPQETIELYRYSPVHLEVLGPDPPDEEALETIGYLNHIRSASEQESAGGFDSKLACMRALLDVVNGLYYLPLQVS